MKKKEENIRKNTINGIESKTKTTWSGIISRIRKELVNEVSNTISRMGWKYANG